MGEWAGSQTSADFANIHDEYAASVDFAAVLGQAFLKARWIKNKSAANNELKLDPQGRLDHARPATYYACSSANRGGGGSGNSRRDLAEIPAALVRPRVSEVSVVEEIEEVRPELQMDFLGAQREFLGSRKIVVGQAWAVIVVAPRGANAAGRRRGGKERLIERRIRLPGVLM